MRTPTDKIVDAIHAACISPNEADSNFEPANIVDGLFAIARSLDRIAKALTTNQENT